MQQRRARLEGVKRAVWFRERGQISEAVTLIDQVIATCNQQSDWVGMADALGERIICWKHMFQNLRGHGHDKLLGLMRADAQAGLRLQVPAESKAPFYLRLGDCFTFSNNPVLAELAYHKAKDLKAGAFDEGEYTAHWAESLLVSGRIDDAVRAIRRSLILATASKSLYEYWHWLIVVSGILSRKVKIDRANGDTRGAVKAFAKSYGFVWILLVWYRKPQRWRQYHQGIRDELLKLVRRR